MRHLHFHPVRHRNAWSGFSNFHRHFNNYLPTFFENEEESEARWLPLVDVTELEDKFEFAVELPGIEKNHISLEVKDEVLTISGKKTVDREKKERSLHMTERGYGSFSRSFRLPRNVSADSIDAEFLNGVLVVSLPKLEEDKPKQIEIKIN